MAKTAQQNLWKLQLRFVLTILVLTGLLLVVSAKALLAHTPEQTTQIFDRNGRLIYQVFASENRVYTPLEKIPKHLQAATIAAEDKRFYWHYGVDPIATLRALKETVFQGNIQGGSTITQQYVRNAFLTPEQSVSRKIKEIVLASFLELFTSKEKILEKYLNQVAYGGVNYGVGAAARYYFDKDVSELTLAEAAFLASLPKAPSKLSPENSEIETTSKRQKQILEKMEDLGFITSGEREKAEAEKLEFTFTQPVLSAPHFSMMVKEELIKKFGPDLVETGGLKVKTTLDLQIQKKAEQIVAQEIEKLKSFKVSNGALLVANPKTGEILALVGSANYFSPNGGNFNVITSGKRQPGSAIKPVMYAAAFEAGYTPATVIFDIPTVFYNQWEKYAPVNYDNRFHGPVPIRYALANSYNVPAIRMLATIGPDTLIAQAQEMGIENLEKNGMGLSLTVGGGAIKPIELAQSFQVLANKGIKKDLFAISEVRDSNGRILFTQTQEGEEVLDEKITFLLADILSDNEARTWAFGSNSLLTIPGHKVAVKTGTSDDKRDNWAIGFTPEVLVLSWVGNNDNSPMHQQLASGITGATPIWHHTMKMLLSDRTPTWYEQPGGIITKEVDFLTGKLACGRGKVRVEYFIAGTEPKDCGKVKKVLVQNVNGEETILTEVPQGEETMVLENVKKVKEDQTREQSEENVQAAVFEVKVLPQIQDPLMEKTGERSLIFYPG